MSLYGYPIETTPFLKRTRGLFLLIIFLQHLILNHLYFIHFMIRIIMKLNQIIILLIWLIVQDLIHIGYLIKEY
nr:hypothetical protein [Pasteurella multocida]